MRFLLDENTHGDLGALLLALGHDANEVRRTTSDRLILAQAVLEQRVLVTHDRDFGNLVFGQGHAHAGIIYLRLSSTLPAFVLSRIEAALDAGYPEASFLVVRDRTVRLRLS
jgi:predicted nuclease of predicted toxin-antitoxin system